MHLKSDNSGNVNLKMFFLFYVWLGLRLGLGYRPLLTTSGGCAKTASAARSRKHPRVPCGRPSPCVPGRPTPRGEEG